MVWNSTIMSWVLSSLRGLDTCSSLVCFASVLLLLRAYQVFRGVSNLPPGPWGLPLLGYLPYLTGIPHEQFYHLSKKYGSIFSARLGSQLVVVLADYKSIRNAFRKQTFSGRPLNDITLLMEGFGIINIDGDLWKEQRRFLHERLRAFGMKQAGAGKEQLEARIMVEVEAFLQNLANNKGKPTNISQVLALSVSNVICSMLMSMRFTPEDKKFKRFAGLIEEGFKLVCDTQASNFLPCLKNLDKYKDLNAKILSNRAEMQNFYKEIVDEHKRTFDPGNIRDLVDTYLLEIDLAKREGREEFLFGGKDADRQIYQILGDLFSAGMFSSNRAEMQNFYKEIVDEHKRTFDPGNIRDLVDTYLLEIDLAKREGREEFLFGGKDADRQIYQILGDLFSAGMETIKTTLQWATIYMIHQPEVMKTVQDELDQVVGRSRLPTLEDMPYLPYTEATILEILRRSTVVPLGTTHAANKQIELEGYTIPQDAHIIPLIHAVHMDPALWHEPEKFNPSRFLGPDGTVTKPEYFMPFGVGRRMCLGDVLAKMELFLFFTSLLHVFNLELPQGEALPSLAGDGATSVTLSPDQCNVCVIPRQIELNSDLNISRPPSPTAPAC